MRRVINNEDKLRCLAMFSEGLSYTEIFESYYADRYPGTNYETFRKLMNKWKHKFADTDTLHSGTYPNFSAHGATVQVNKAGEVVQAWIKQHSTEVNWNEIIEDIKNSTNPVLVEHKDTEIVSNSMLEIPLYDMHFPFSNYNSELEDILYLINKCEYDEINLIIGQDLFHNDDFRGRTSSGRPIEKVDMREAWRLAEEFWYNIIYESLRQSKKVNLIYSKGNHDESMSWAFVKRLEALFPELNVDDDLDTRKCIYWKECFIGISHGCMKKNNDSKSLRSQFTIDYPQEFAKARVREIHVGHVHHEEAGDIYGVTVRRLSTAVPTDEWSDNEGYIGAHKRFMIFEYEPGYLKSIHFTR